MPKILGVDEPDSVTSDSTNTKAVISATPVKRKKNFFGKLSEDGKDVGSLLYEDTIKPGIQNLAYSIFDETVGVLDGIAKRLIFKDDVDIRGKRKKKNGGIAYIGYDEYWDDRHKANNKARINSSLDFDQLLYDTKSEAEKVLTKMQIVIEDFDKVSLADYYEFSNTTAPHTYVNYGWYNLESASVKRIRYNGEEKFVLVLPKPRQF